MVSSKDSLYAAPLGEINRFEFDVDVVNVFPDMIQRSVPGYTAIIHAIGLLAARFAQPNSVCYDLGCSLGAATLSMREQITTPSCRIVAVDNSAAMVKQLKLNISATSTIVPVDIYCADIREFVIENASVIVLNFTLQFIPIVDRLAFVKTLYSGLLPGGVLILSEKLQFEDPRQAQLQTEMHHSFKKAQGYSDLEISQKRNALEHVLIPETYIQHRQRLTEAGFSSVEVWFQYFNFASMIALK